MIKLQEVITTISEGGMHWKMCANCTPDAKRGKTTNGEREPHFLTNENECKIYASRTSTSVVGKYDKGIQHIFIYMKQVWAAI